MLKSEKNIKSFDLNNLSLKKPSIESSATEISKQFIGYIPVKKGYVFRSSSEKFYPLRRDPSLDQWIENCSSETTIRWRKNFQVFADVKNCFKFYQLFPVKIPYIDCNGKKCNYAPLVLFTFWNDDLSPRNRKSLLIDVRSDVEVRENARTLIPAFRAANHFSQRRKLKFRVLRDKFFNSVYFANLCFMNQFCLSGVEYEIHKLVKDTLTLKGPTKFIFLTDMISETLKAKNSEKIAHDIWSLVQQGWISANWKLPFDQNTILWV